MRAAWLLALFLLACSKPDRGTDRAVCDGYIAMLEATAKAPPPGFPDEAVVRWRDTLPLSARFRPVPSADEAAADQAVEDGRAVTGDRTYVAADATAPARDLGAGELRLLVRKPDEAVVADHLKVVPRTPDKLRDQLVRYATIDKVAVGDELLRLSAPCADLRKVFDALADGAPVVQAGPMAADALRRCQCKVDHLDGYVSLLTWLVLPYPRVGYLPVPAGAIDALPPDATVADLVLSLGR